MKSINFVVREKVGLCVGNPQAIAKVNLVASNKVTINNSSLEWEVQDGNMNTILTVLTMLGTPSGTLAEELGKAIYDEDALIEELLTSQDGIIRKLTAKIYERAKEDLTN